MVLTEIFDCELLPEKQTIDSNEFCIQLNQLDAEIDEKKEFKDPSRQFFFESRQKML